MASIITATTTSGLTQSADNSGVLQLASGAGNLVTVPASTGTFITTTGGVAPSTAGNVLTSDGTSWVSSTPSVPSAGTGPAFFAYQSTQQFPSSNTWTKVNLQTELFDTNNNFATSRFTPTVAGYYQINGAVGNEDNNVAHYLQCAVYKNGTRYSEGGSAIGSNNEYPVCMVATIVYLNGSTDYVELYYYGDSINLLHLNQRTNLNGALVRAA